MQYKTISSTLWPITTLGRDVTIDMYIHYPNVMSWLIPRSVQRALEEIAREVNSVEYWYISDLKNFQRLSRISLVSRNILSMILIILC